MEATAKANRYDRINYSATYDFPHRTATCRHCGEAISGATYWSHTDSGVCRCAGVPHIASPVA